MPFQFEYNSNFDTILVKHLNVVFQPIWQPYFLQNNKLDAKQSGFRSGHSTETALLSVTEALQIAKADSKSSVLILLDLSAAFDTVNHQILLSTLSSLDITGIPLRWFESYLTGRSFRMALGRGGIQSTSIGYWGSPGIGSWTPPLLHIHYITGSHQVHGFSYHCYADDTQLYLSFQPDDPTVAARIAGCLADISAWMKEHHLQLNLAKTELLVFPATPTLQHDFTISRFINNYTINFCQKYWCNVWWPADLQRAHCKDCSILQVYTTQHQKEQALSDRACCTTSCPGPCHFQAGLLRCSSGWTSIKHNQTSTNDSECSSMTGLQRAQKSPCYTSLYLLALATSCSSHPVQDTDACI